MIIGSQSDPNAQYVAQAVARQKGEVCFFDAKTQPEEEGLVWHEGEVLLNERPLHSYRSFYLKSIHLSLPVADPGHFSSRNLETWQEQYVAARERHSFLTAILKDLDEQPQTCFVNSISSIDLHFFKVLQLSRLRRAGLDVPATMASTSPDAVRSFAAQYGSVIYKPLSGGALVQRLTEADLAPERLTLIQHAPVLFQEEIQGDEFRVYVLDGEPVAAFQLPTKGVVDARQALDKVQPAELPVSIWAKCIKAAQVAGVLFSAIDMRRTQEGREVILECNPTPAISFFDDPVDGVVIKRLAGYLVKQA